MLYSVIHKQISDLISVSNSKTLKDLFFYYYYVLCSYFSLEAPYVLLAFAIALSIHSSITDGGVTGVTAASAFFGGGGEVQNSHCCSSPMLCHCLGHGLALLCLWRVPIYNLLLGQHANCGHRVLYHMILFLISGWMTPKFGQGFQGGYKRAICMNICTAPFAWVSFKWCFWQ